jgi:hypothetical protein
MSLAVQRHADAAPHGSSCRPDNNLTHSLGKSYGPEGFPEPGASSVFESTSKAMRAERELKFLADAETFKAALTNPLLEQ